jgi:uridine kinase
LSKYISEELSDYSVLFNKITELLQLRETVNIAIEGNCGSGKSTLADIIASKYDCNVFRMDDFFLRPEQKTAERLIETGGNIDYERFVAEIAGKLKALHEIKLTNSEISLYNTKGIKLNCNESLSDTQFDQEFNSDQKSENITDEDEDKNIFTDLLPFSYRKYDCKTLTLSNPTSVAPKRLNVIEGCYSLHPAIPDIYDLKIFLKIDPDIQSQRILARNGEFMHKRFLNEWIPMENEYFKALGIEGKCDLVYNNK